MRSIHVILQQDVPDISSRLDIGVSSARIEVQCLLQQVLNVQRAYLLAHSEYQLDSLQHSAYSALLDRRLAGEPIAYILGEREFFGMNFKVTPATLIPRPDTELLVELALQRIPQGRGCKILDMGTGSGAIALSIARARPDAEILATDLSEAALQVASQNALRLGVSNVGFIRSDWFSALNARRFHLIVSNPPYVRAHDEHLIRGDVRFEPVSALVSGDDGLKDIRRIVLQAAMHLEQKGCLLLEHGYDQADEVGKTLDENDFKACFSAKDMSGITRVSGGYIGV